jgi:hypothetical protein
VRKYVDVTSRYTNSKVVYYNGDSNQRFLTFDTYKRQAIQPSSDDKFTIISATSQYRPDLVSNAFYGAPHFWWKIMEFNGIYDIMDFKAGVTLRLPAAV